jgi:transposase
MSKIRFIGLDVHADTIAASVAEPDGEVRPLGIIPNRLESVRKLVTKLGPVKEIKACYEAGPTGYVLYWQLTQLGVACEVIAPSLVPVKAGDRVKTDRRDAAKLARSYRAGDLTPVWVPDAAHEALRDLVRARGCPAGSTPRPPASGQILAATRPASPGGREKELDAKIYDVD